MNCIVGMGCPLLIRAWFACSTDTQILLRLLQVGADPNAESSDGKPCPLSFDLTPAASQRNDSPPLNNRPTLFANPAPWSRWLGPVSLQRRHVKSFSPNHSLAPSPQLPGRHIPYQHISTPQGNCRPSPTLRRSTSSADSRQPAPALSNSLRPTSPHRPSPTTYDQHQTPSPLIVPQNPSAAISNPEKHSSSIKVANPHQSSLTVTHLHSPIPDSHVGCNHFAYTHAFMLSLSATRFYHQRSKEWRRGFFQNVHVCPGLKPLFFAARSGALEAAQVLVEFGADVQNATYSRCPALFCHSILPNPSRSSRPANPFPPSRTPANPLHPSATF